LFALTHSTANDTARQNYQVYDDSFDSFVESCALYIDLYSPLGQKTQTYNIQQHTDDKNDDK